MDNGQLERVSACLVFGSGCNGIVLLVLCSSLFSYCFMLLMLRSSLFLYYVMALVHIWIILHARGTVLAS